MAATSLNLNLILLLLLVFRPETATGQLEYDLENEIARLSSGSCRKSGMCCPGRDSSGVVQQAKPNAIIEDLDDVPCYCDHACADIGDCCPDFKAACGASEEYMLEINEFLKNTKDDGNSPK